MVQNGDHHASMWDESRQVAVALAWVMQLGQLFFMGFDGTTITDQVRVLIENYHVGSILLTAKNIQSAAQTTQLVVDLQSLAHRAGHSVPLLIAIDQENGGVNSLHDELYIRQFPSAMGMAAAGSKTLAKEVSRATAQELSSCGINWILGPVLDVLTNTRNQPLGVRSLGDDAQEVSAYGISCMRGYQEAGLATCGKHFPSYGNLEFFGPPTDVPTITDSLESLSQSALVPFRKAIAAGIDAMMVGGVAMSSSGINAVHACLSEAVVQDLLRHKMRFEGVVVSECLEMEALSRNIGISNGTVMAFKAGCDLILTCRRLSAQEEAINGLKAGLDNGMIERFRVQESVQRVLDLKSKYTSWEKAFSPPGVDNLNRLQPLHNSLSMAAYNKSITIVRDLRKYLPLNKTIRQEDELLLLTPLIKPLPGSPAHKALYEDSPGLRTDFWSDSERNAMVMSGEKVFRELGRALARQRKGRVSHTSYTANGVRPLHESLVSRAKAVVVVTADAGRNMYQNAFAKHVAMMCKLLAGQDDQFEEKPCIVVAVSSPFDFAADPAIGTYLCTYDYTDTALLALVKVLYGELVATGTLPGTLSQKTPAKNSRQQWLVENFTEERDSAALNTLLELIGKETSTCSSLVRGTTSSTFLLRSPRIEEGHFVVRNSSTKELFGFCATYYSPIANSGYVGAILVDPARRKQSIGYSLHTRAIRALLQRAGIKRFQLGSQLPGVYAGLPKSNPAEYTSLRQWFAKLGWNFALTNPICCLQIRDLGIWVPPTGLGKALASTEIKYDLVHGPETRDAVIDHVKRSDHIDHLPLYEVALDDKVATGIIRAKRAADGGIQGSLILCREDSRITSFRPGFDKDRKRGCILCPVLSPTAKDQQGLLQGLVLLGIRQLKKAGLKSIVLDCVNDDGSIKALLALGFQVSQTFDEVSGDPDHWTMNPG
ncbi:hypothetical protein DV735_g3335, partial [Chaetothyriales sp. CBS 134920]